MHSRTKEVLIDNFASHLKIRNIVDASALTLLAQKYLALGVNVVPTQRVYDAISTDYTLLAMRTHYPPLSAYSEPKNAPFDPAVFTEIIKQGFDTKKHTKLIESSTEFNRFVDVVTERAPNQERWVDVCRQDKWKDVALYLGLNYKENPSFYRLLKVIAEKEEDVSLLNKRMLAYKPRDTQALGREMTAFIQSINLPVEFCEEVFSSFTSSSKEDAKEKVTIEEVPKQKVPTLKTNTEVAHKVDSLKERMEDYRKRSGLSAVVDTKRVAQQMVYACLGENIPPTLLTRNQKELSPIQGEQEAELVLDIIESDALDENTLHSMLSTSQKASNVMRVTNQYEWDARALLQHVLQPEKFLDERTLARLNKLI